MLTSLKNWIATSAAVVSIILAADPAFPQAVGTYTVSNANTASVTAGTVTASALVSARSNVTAATGWGGAYAGGTNFPGTWYTPNTMALGNFRHFELNNQTNGTIGSVVVSYTFNVPVTNPIFHFANSDAGQIDFSATTTTSGGTATATRLSGNTELEVAGLIANTTPHSAINTGCEANDTSNPEGACGSIQLTGTYSVVRYTITDTTTSNGTGDGHGLALFLPADYGDAPSSYGSAAHIVNATHHIGSSVDVELANQPGAGASLDGADDDGVTIPTLTRSQTSIINVSVQGSGGVLSAWIDYNGGGTFGGGEQIATNIQDGGGGDANPAAGIIGISVTPPATTTTNQTYARFRWSLTSSLAATGNASAGEVEDLALTIGAFSVAKVASPTSLSAPGTITYTITVDNTVGSGNINSPVLTDTLMQGVLPRTLTSGPTYSSGNLDGDSRIDVGEAWVYTASYTVSQTEFDLGTSYFNSATLTSSNTANRTSNTATTALAHTPSITLLKEAEFVTDTGAIGVADVGDVIRYRFTITNDGNVTISNVTDADTAFNGTGTAPGAPGLESDVSVPGGSSDAVQDGSYDTLRPGDVIRFATTSPDYAVVQADIDTLQ